MSLPVLLSWSGGKDAAWTLHTLRQRGDIHVVGLVTTLTEGYDRISMQGIRRGILYAQAEACGLPVIEAWMPQRASNELYRAAFADALLRARERWPGLRDIAFGDLFLQDIRAYRETLCAELDWTPHFPIFDPTPGYTANLAREMIAAGLRAQLVCVDTEPLDAGFSGSDFDELLLRDLPESCDPCGENGEFHTLVHAGPMFSAPISVSKGEIVLRDGRFSYTDYLL
ncbi:MAG: ATP-binding protein [Lysobacteraceae bacterium]